MTLSPPIEIAPTLLSAPIELAGNWGHVLPRSADMVVERMRLSCLDGVRLVSGRQPTRLRVAGVIRGTFAKTDATIDWTFPSSNPSTHEN